MPKRFIKHEIIPIFALMKKVLLLPVALLVSWAAAAQSPEADILADRTRAGGNYHSYEFAAAASTPAPKGFKPFYISHYSRHGSRNISHDSFKYPVGKLDAMDRKGLLNKRGKTLLKELKGLYEMTEGHWGDLSARGREEHARIATEMTEQYPGIFSGTPRIRARSSYSKRCLESMDSFTGALQAVNGNAVIDKDGGKRYRYYINDGGKEVSAPASKTADSLKKAWLSAEAILAPLVTDCPAALALMHHPDKFAFELCEVCLIAQCMPTETDLTAYIPEAELIKFWRVKNVLIWLRHGRSPEYGALRVPLARNLALDFIHKADSSIWAGNNRADLRFGHDSALLPLMCYLGADGFDRELSWEESDAFHSYSQICMASNFQLVFYRDPVGRILVRGVYNGRETHFPALGPGPYYPWNRFRDYVLSLP